MIKPRFSLLLSNHYRDIDDWSPEQLLKRGSGDRLSTEVLQELGWESFIGQPGFNNTCAIRMSLALARQTKLFW